MTERTREQCTWIMNNGNKQCKQGEGLGPRFESWHGLGSGDPTHEWEGKRLAAVTVILYQLAWLTGV